MAIQPALLSLLAAAGIGTAGLLWTGVVPLPLDDVGASREEEARPEAVNTADATAPESGGTGFAGDDRDDPDDSDDREYEGRSEREDDDDHEDRDDDDDD